MNLNVNSTRTARFVSRDELLVVLNIYNKHAECSIRGATHAPKYKGFILPLIFPKRLCDVFDDELDRMGSAMWNHVWFTETEARNPRAWRSLRSGFE